MAKSQIGAIIKLDGESQFRASIQNCKSSSSALRAELKTIQETYKGNANSLEALTAMHDQYAKMQETAQDRVEKANSAYEASTRKTEEVKAAMREMLSVYEDAEKKLQKMKSSGNASADAIAEQSKAVDAAYEDFQRYATAVEKCESKTNYFRKAVADAETEEKKASVALEKYAGYIKEASRSADGTASSIDRFGKEVKNSGEAADNAGTAVGVFQGSLAAGFVTAGLQKVCELLRDAAAYAIDVGSTFEASMSKVAAISGLSSEKLNTLKELSESLGRSTQFSASQVADAFSYMALAGWDAQQMISSIRGVLNLAAASEMDLSEASDIVTDYITAFGLSAEDASHFVDVMATAMTKSNTDTEQLGEAYKNVASTAGSLGYSLEDTTAALMTMANAGVKGSEAGTTLNALMVRLSTNTKNCADELSQYGVKIYDSNGKMRSLSSILNDVSGAFAGLTDEEGANLAKIVAGQNQYAGFMTVLQGMSEQAASTGQSFNDYTDMLTECSGAAQNMADTMNDNLKGSFKEAASAAEGLGIAAYDYIDGPLRAAVNGVTDILNGITDAITPQRTALDGFVDSIDRQVTSINRIMENADIEFEANFADASKVASYIDIIEKCRNKTSLTEFETYQLNTAVETLGGTIPELNQYIGETNKLLELSDADFNAVKNSMTSSYNAMMAAAIAAKRNAYMQAKVEADIALSQAQSALDEANRQVEEQQEVLTELNEKRDAVPFADFGKVFNYTQQINDANEVMTDFLIQQRRAKSEFEDASEAMSDASDVVDEYDRNSQELYDKYGLYIDKTGELTTATQEAKDATDKAGKSAEGIADAFENGAERIMNTNIADSIKQQMAAAMESVQDFKDSLSSSFSSFSLFGDTEKLIDIYTGGGKDEMQKNASIMLNMMDKYTGEIENLVSRGVSNDFIQYMMSQGQEGLKYIHSLAQWTSDAELEEFQKQFDIYASYIDGSNASVKKLLDTYSASVMAGVGNAYDSWYQFGIQSTQGLLDALDDAANALSDGSVSGTIKDAINTILNQRQEQHTASQNVAKINSATSNRLPASDLNRDITVNDTIRDGQVLVKVQLDSEDLINKFTATRMSRGKITGRG